MGKLILIMGENDSGKSLFAEKLASGFQGRKYYAATMLPKTEDNYIRIEKHRKQREGHDFTTLELPFCLEDGRIGYGGIVLLEDVSNLLANNIFEKNKSADEVYDDILKLSEKCRAVIAVTISGLESPGYDGQTAEYIDRLNEINLRLYEKASEVIRMSDGKSIYEKVEDNEHY